MKRLHNKALRNYHLNEGQGAAAIAALVVLAEGLEGADVQVSRSDRPSLPAAKLPKSVLPALVDLLSLLIAKGDGTIFVLDGNDEISLDEAVRFMQTSRGTLNKLMSEGELDFRMEGEVTRLRIADVLNCMTESRRPLRPDGYPDSRPQDEQDEQDMKDQECQQAKRTS